VKKPGFPRHGKRAVREQTGRPRTDRACGTGHWEPGEVRLLSPRTAERLVAAGRGIWKDITRKGSIPGTVCATPGCDYECCGQGDRTLCLGCWRKELDARRRLNVMRGLCKCGRPRRDDLLNCDRCRELDRQRQRRYRAKKKRERSNEQRRQIARRAARPGSPAHGDDSCANS